MKNGLILLGSQKQKETKKKFGGIVMSHAEYCRTSSNYRAEKRKERKIERR